ncbi:hypothetical protein [Streptomyces gardneri]|uniref:hypothetical protein n=1 Tax=Streptomyces gardneri TaxID=66892 RepID=UPI0035D62540
MPDSVRTTLVKVPMRIIAGPYSDLAVVLHAKTAHLSRNEQRGSVADLTTIAVYLGLTNRLAVDPRTGNELLKAPSALYAAQKELTSAKEMTVERRTLPGGTGTSAVRRVSGLGLDEAFAFAPVALLGAVSPRHVRAYLVCAYAYATRTPMTAEELSGHLRHHSGKNAGEPISERSARMIVDDLERWGWLDMDRRAGRQGRNLITPRRSPLGPVTCPENGRTSGAELEETSGPEPARTSLANEELQPEADVQEIARDLVGGSARRASSVVARGPVENPAAGTFDQAVASPGAASPEPRGDSPTAISATAHRVLRLLPLEFTPGQCALAAKAIERSVSEVGDVERILNRVHRHLANEGQAVREPYGWLITRGLRNDPCPAPACEEGQLWPTGENCRICIERWADRRSTPVIFRNSKPVFEVTWNCVDCERPGHGERPADDVCSRCHAEAGIAFASLFAHSSEIHDEAHEEWNARRAAEARAEIRRPA